MSTQNSCIARKSELCIAGFEALSKLLADAEVQEQFGIKQMDCNDELSRFKLWAGNIGALQDSRLASSLEHRLRDARGVANRVIDLLEEMIEDLEAVRAILSSEQPNQTSTITYLPEFQKENADDESYALAEPEERSEIQEIFGSVADLTVELFKISMLIRKATPRDRYLKATAHAKEPFDDRYDVAHMEQKFPKLARPDRARLKALLGKAITQRREFLRYARDHRYKLSAKQDPQIAEDARLEERKLDLFKTNQQRKQNAGSLISGARLATTLAPTNASTLLPSNLEDMEFISDEEQSLTSFATSIAQNGEKLHIVALSQVSKGKFPFECSYCYQIVRLRRERSWRKHVLRDLRPYLCTFDGCDMTLYPDRSTWFNHELEIHRSQWHCQFCHSHSPYTSREAFESHLKRQHSGKFVEAQLPTLTRICQQPVGRISSSDCPFCDDWENTLRANNAHLATENIVVTPVEFRNHLAAHMEQLALFAVPMSVGADEEASADSNTVNFKQEKSLSHIHLEKTLSASSAGHAVDEMDPLSFAVSHGLDAEVSQLLEDHPNLNQSEFFAALREAGTQGHISTVNIVLDKFEGSVVSGNWKTHVLLWQLVQFVSGTGHREIAELIQRRLEVYFESEPPQAKKATAVTQERTSMPEPSKLEATAEIVRNTAGAGIPDGAGLGYIDSSEEETGKNITIEQQNLSGEMARGERQERMEIGITAEPVAESEPGAKSKCSSQKSGSSTHIDHPTAGFSTGFDTFSDPKIDINDPKLLELDTPFRLFKDSDVIAREEYGAAEVMSRRSLDGSGKALRLDHPDTLTSVSNMASVLQDQGMYDEAEATNRLAHGMREEALGVEHPDTPTSVNNLAMLVEDHPGSLALQHELAPTYLANGQVKQAVALLEHVVRVEKTTLAEDHPDRLASQHELARAYVANGQIEQAVELLEQVFKIRETTLAETHPYRLASQHELALAYQANGQIEQAIELLEQVVKIQETTLAETHPSQLASQHELARAYQANGQIEEAVELLGQVVKIQETTLAKTHPSRLGSEHQLAVAYRSNGQIEQAVGLLEHVVKIQETTLAETHPDWLASQHDLAVACQANGQIERAVKLLEQVVKVQEITLTETHPDQLISQQALARAYGEIGQVEQAVQLLEHVVKIKETTLAQTHPYRLTSQHELARAYQANGQIEQAIELLEHVVKVRETTLAETHPDRLTSQHALAIACQVNGQTARAVKLLEQVVKVRNTTLVGTHPRRLASQHQLAGAYQKNGQIEQAIELLEQVVKVEETTLDETHPDRLASQHELARAYLANGQIERAVELLEQVVKIRENRLVETHPDRLASQRALAVARQELGQVK